ncbi:relaxase/mobilization nuclease domain-containing protein [Corynebacterium afermentans]|uniref:relaxase/mobilization nuclease domain-containing protein n=1 Tax=Corynebacterium afermentans TaxID=38286 RepID=UPI00257402DE|nr:relaxase/mobilization nuclease domain-containing protein [Corynebacterium afermentans]MCG7292402.1 relaxase/mobilization nuclease domain-containing protein [Corynebacterium afermentans]
MSVVKVQRTKSVAAATIYAVHGTHENMRNGVVRAAAYSVVGVSPEATPMQFVSDTVAEHARHPQRETQAILVIQSFHPDELDKDDPFDVQLAHLAGMELARRLAPNSDVVVATHTDSDSGHLHNHITWANHDRVTGKTLRNARNFHAVSRVNDQVMNDLGLEVYEPQVLPQLDDLSHLRGAPLPELTTENWRAEMTQRVDAVLADPRVAAASSVADGLDVAQNIAAEYSVSFQVREHEKQGRDDVTATVYALIDDDGEPVRYATSRGSRPTSRTGSRLGKEDYTFEAVERRIEQLQQQYQQVVQQQQISIQQENYRAQEAQEEPTATPADQAVGTAGAGGAKSLRRYLDTPDDADTGNDTAPDAEETTADTGNDTAPDAEETTADTVHDSGAGRAVGHDGERDRAGRPGENGRDLRQGRARREDGASVSRSRSEVQQDAQRARSTQQQPTERSSAASAGSSSSRQAGAPASWSPDESVEDMRQVDYDFLEQRVMDDEFRQFQRSEFDGSDRDYLAFLLDDDDVVAAEHDAYVRPRVNPVRNPHGRDQMLRTVGENRRRLEAQRRATARRRQQQQQHQAVTPDF